MLATRHGIARQSSSAAAYAYASALAPASAAGYVCLSCRCRAKQRHRQQLEHHAQLERQRRRFHDDRDSIDSLPVSEPSLIRASYSARTPRAHSARRHRPQPLPQPEPEPTRLPSSSRRKLALRATRHHAPKTTKKSSRHVAENPRIKLQQGDVPFIQTYASTKPIKTYESNKGKPLIRSWATSKGIAAFTKVPESLNPHLVGEKLMRIVDSHILEGWAKGWANEAVQPSIYQPLRPIGATSYWSDEAPANQTATHHLQFPARDLQSRAFAWHPKSLPFAASYAHTSTTHARLFHASAKPFQQASAVVHEADHGEAPPALDPQQRTGIRKQLQAWQDLHGNEDPTPDIQPEDDLVGVDGMVNNFTRLPNAAAMNRYRQQDTEEEEVMAKFSVSGREGFEEDAREDVMMLEMGDLVELEFQGERDGLLAIYVRQLDEPLHGCQFFTMHGKWLHASINTVQFSAPGFISPKLIEPLLQHLPKFQTYEEMQALSERAYLEDLSIPREVAAPVVTKLLKFHHESNEIYRKNARALDNAHNILAHETDLRYGSLASAATTLLRLPGDRLPLTALFAVRRTLNNAGFAFNMDRRSHRHTGYMQIRSKAQVKMVETVRTWFRQWQDHVASTVGMDETEAIKLRVPRGAQHVYSFISKAKAIVMKNRQNRECRPAIGNVGISKVRLPITDLADCIRVDKSEEFTLEETEIVRFIEAYACANMFQFHARMQGLTPLLLHATGLYEQNSVYSVQLAYVFLQEIGTIMPYENRVRFDAHLLLPSSQQSRPLQNLMTSLLKMKATPNFEDSMAGLRHDWGDMPVYCIDRVDAQEIDDGISIESAGVGADGKEQHWAHIHIANPTAFFSRDHPMSKMARHMGETIYMPERTYMMLPRWTTQRHFSLGNDRPCLTFSAKLDSEGRTLENKITSGIVRNVIRMTAQEVNGILGNKTTFEEQHPEHVYTVGGEPPPAKPRQSRVNDMTDRNKQELRTLDQLADKLTSIRKAAGGFFFDMHLPEVQVWQRHSDSGLAWDMPWRKGRRTVEGDPVVQFRTRGLINWFLSRTSTADLLVREFMLLACQISATWCADRKIPVIYRGSIRVQGSRSPEQYHREVLSPHLREDGSVPLHLGRTWVALAGKTVLRTQPKRHTPLGMSHYSKATSPLRRYGDMILHWQIEAALRHEAETGRSLVVPPDTPTSQLDRSFLPFSEPVLETIMLGLQPREGIIMRAKAAAEKHWSTLLFARKFYYGDGGSLPFLTGPDGSGHDVTNLPPLRLWVENPHAIVSGDVLGPLLELNMVARMSTVPGLPEVKYGDVWEVRLEGINVFTKDMLVRPLRLLGREGAGII